jgi:hypothetical protein
MTRSLEKRYFKRCSGAQGKGEFKRREIVLMGCDGEETFCLSGAPKASLELGAPA